MSIFSHGDTAGLGKAGGTKPPPVVTGRGTPPSRDREAGPTPGRKKLHHHLLQNDAGHSFAADQYRTLRHAVEMACAKQGARVIGVTSAVAGDGKTVTCLNLATTLAQSVKSRVLVVDADLRRPSVGRYLAVSDGSSLPDLIRDPHGTLEQGAVRVDRLNFSVVTARTPPGGTYELLSAPRLGQLLRDARRAFDYVIVDTPPLVPVPDTRLLAAWVDTFLVVVGAGRTPKPLLDEALSSLDRSRILGLVFNGASEPHAYYRRYFDGYYGGGQKRRRNA